MADNHDRPPFSEPDKRRAKRPNERGAALLSVLLLVAIMSATAAATLDDIRFAIRRAANTTDSEQAVWYALGAETFARQIIWRAWRADPQRDTLLSPWAQDRIELPIDGGWIEGGIRDGSTCLNLNALLGGSPDDVRLLLTSLIMMLENPSLEPESLASAIVDWIDPDDRPLPRGAEDGDYAALIPPYRPANGALAEVAELRAVQGMTEEAYQLLRPLVCALPENAPALLLNMNMLEERHAPLIAVAIGSPINIEDAIALIRERPEGGWPAPESFWSSEVLGDHDFTSKHERFTENTRYFDIGGRVNLRSASVEFFATLEQTPDGEFRVVSRRYGALE